MHKSPARPFSVCLKQVTEKTSLSGSRRSDRGQHLNCTILPYCLGAGYPLQRSSVTADCDSLLKYLLMDTYVVALECESDTLRWKHCNCFYNK